MLIAFLKFQHVTMMVFNVCVNDTVHLIHININVLVEELLIMSL